MTIETRIKIVIVHYLMQEKNLSIDELLQGDFVCIVGQPGIGKSRLVNEIKRHPSKDRYILAKHLNKIPF